MSELQYTLVRNGLDFIVSSVLAINRGDGAPGDLKYAVLHLWSGVLLLLKERIRREHWTLLFSNSANINIKAYESGDFQSIAFDQIEKILLEVCDIKFSPEAFKALSSLRRKRNEIEHFSFALNANAVKSTTAKVLDFMVSFIDQHLDPEEFTPDETVLFDKLKIQMKTFDEFVEHRMRGINKQLKNFSDRVLYCITCENKSLIPDDSRVFRCKFCLDKTKNYPQIANEYLEHEFGISAYLEIKDGGEWPQYECFDCETEAMIPADEQHTEYFCVACACTYGKDDVQFCTRCGTFSREDEMGICEACIEDRLRDD